MRSQLNRKVRLQKLKGASGVRQGCPCARNLPPAGDISAWQSVMMGEGEPLSGRLTNGLAFGNRDCNA